MINIYLDDLRDIPTNWIGARNMESAIALLKENEYKVNRISLDHDLGEKDNVILPTGYDFVKLFCEHGWYANEIYIHTDNPVGRENMYETLLAAQRRGFISKEIKIFRYGAVPNKYTVGKITQLNVN